MFSTTVSTVSTAECPEQADNIAHDLRSTTTEVFTQEPIYPTLDDIVAEKICHNFVQRKQSKFCKDTRSIEKVCRICEENAENLKKSVKHWAEKKYNNECLPLSTTRQRHFDRINRIQRCANDFEKSPNAWFIPKKTNVEEIESYKRFYCHPKIMIQLELGFDDHYQILDYAQNGIRLFMINLQYGTRKQHNRTFKCIQRAVRYVEQNVFLDCEIGVIAEITDRKLTTGLLKGNASDVFLDRDSRLVLTSDRRFSHRGTHEVVYVNFKNYINVMKPKDIIKIGFKIEVRVTEVLVNSLVCTVLAEGKLEPRMTVVVPEVRNLVGKYTTVEEEADINFVLEHSNCDYIVCPCAHNINVCQYIRWFMATHQRRMFIIGKIHPDLYLDENILMKMSQEFTCLWIDSSQLEAPSQIETTIVRKCCKDGIPLMRSAHFIQSEHIQMPKDPEICRNILLYPDCLVISSCLRNKLDPCKIRAIIRQNYPRMNDETLEYCCTFLPRVSSVAHMLVRQVALSVIFAKITCVITVNNTGRSAMLLSQNKLTVPIISTVRDETIARQLLILKSVTPILYYEDSPGDWEQELDDRISYGIDYAKRFGFVRKEDAFIVFFDSKRGLKYADSFRLVTLNE